MDIISTLFLLGVLAGAATFYVVKNVVLKPSGGSKRGYVKVHHSK